MSTPISIKLLPGEYWWGGLARHGDQMPFHAQTHYRQSLHRTFFGNQACPVLVSSHGCYVWSETPFAFEFRDGWLFIDDCTGDVITEQAEEPHLRGAYLAAARRFFPPEVDNSLVN